MPTNADISSVFLDDLPAVTVTVDTSTISGTVAIGDVTIEDVRHVAVVVIYPADDVASLNTSSLGSAVRNTLLSVV